MKKICWPIVLAVSGVVQLRGEELPDRAKVVRHRPSAAVEEGKSFWNGSGMRMIWVKPGKFIMGSPPREVGRDHDEDQVEVEISTGFWLGATEVTRGHWTSVMERGGEWNPTGGSTVPMQAAADRAIQFCVRLTELERKKGRIPKGFRYDLPTEAHWEYACRAGTKGAHAGDLREMAWFRGNEGERGDLGYVAQKKPNAWGFYDMHGNVMEWCSDWYDPKLRGGKDPAGPAAGKGEGLWYAAEGRGRVLRGGCVWDDAHGCRSAARSRWAPTAFRYPRWGFRVALRPVVGTKPEEEQKAQRR
jgi:formylglycine-generating enzyme required for sulfatase activity